VTRGGPQMMPCECSCTRLHNLSLELHLRLVSRQNSKMAHTMMRSMKSGVAHTAPRHTQLNPCLTPRPVTQRCPAVATQSTSTSTTSTSVSARLPSSHLESSVKALEQLKASAVNRECLGCQIWGVHRRAGVRSGPMHTRRTARASCSASGRNGRFE
jgi:hypothetical protein